jgi:beta-1,4-mannosyltransferase
MDELKGKRALVIAQGELAQCPRMLNHARELARAGAEVHLLGYAGLALPADIRGDDMIILHGISGIGTRRWRKMPRALYFAVASLRAIWIAARLTWRAVVTVPRCDFVLAQTPPAFPALAVAWLAARFKGARFIVDWHNLTGAVLALRLGAAHPLVGAMAALEAWFGRRADAHLCVSGAFAQALQARGLAVPVAALRDAPRIAAAPAPPQERVGILQRAAAALDGTWDTAEPVVLVSPTSWSLDEDMGLLLDALAAYAAVPQARPCLLIATGDGPGRAAFAARAHDLARPNLHIVTGWLPEDLYRDLLRAADLGISTHGSASGFDLPIKLVDMAEAGLPALAFDDGACPGEGPTVLEKFSDAAQLTALLARLLADPAALLAKTANAPPKWTADWQRVVLPLLGERP